MIKNKLLLLLNTSAILALSISSISCSNKKQQEINKVYLVKEKTNKLAIDISNNIQFNTYSISIFDAISSFGTNPIKIANLNEFKQKGINVRIVDSNINFEKEEVIIKLLYSTNDNIKDFIFLSKPFKEFKWIDSFDKERIFNEMTKFSIIQWMGKDEKGKDLIRIKNKYALASNINVGPYNGDIPSVNDISYTLTLKGIKEELNNEMISSSIQLKGGTLLYKEPINIKLNIDGKEKLITYKDGKVAKPKIKPTKKGYKFLGWATNSKAKMPDIFVNNENLKIFEKDSTLYAVFKKLPNLSLQVQDAISLEKQTYSLFLEEDGILNKDTLESFLEESKPEPNDKYQFDMNSLTFKDEKGIKHQIEFDEEGNFSFKFNSEFNYEIEAKLNHAPIIIFKSTRDNKIIDTCWAIEEDEEYFAPDLDLDLSNYESRGLFATKYVYKNTNSFYQENEQLEDVQENSQIEVLVSFEQSKSINIDMTDLKKDKLKKSYIFLTLDGKIKENTLPSNINYDWYDGQIKTFWNNEESPNNASFDKRNRHDEDYEDDEDDEANFNKIEFQGWYSDPEFKNKIIFENGVSKQVINSRFIYPKFGVNKWDKIRDIREVLNTVFKIATEGIKASSKIFKFKEDGNKEFVSNLAWYLFDIIQWIVNLSLGGKVDFETFWEGFRNFDAMANFVFHKINPQYFKSDKNKERIKGASKLTFNAALWLKKELIKLTMGLYARYSKSKYKFEVFNDEDIIDTIKEYDFRNFLHYSEEDEEGDYYEKLRSSLIQIIYLEKSNNKNLEKLNDSEEETGIDEVYEKLEEYGLNESDSSYEDVKKWKSIHYKLALIKDIFAQDGIQKLIFDIYDKVKEMKNASALKVTKKIIEISDLLLDKFGIIIKNLIGALNSDDEDEDDDEEEDEDEDEDEEEEE
ncbi:InlB B-repeat-containing protein [Mycoplasma phocimorsus]|uniref:InlB B-repeat-containing protein n=1 Tax=Mycoplasma phocimorsus TaxID=3045839 RepID=UPI0024BF757B|nr:InlB B-repeat-containing protein [Mycoplasma phocimorsus]MDJ1648321.1 InlB B-repeat-containing protein [Mycoplasma phocimorsus]